MDMILHYNCVFKGMLLEITMAQISYSAKIKSQPLSNFDEETTEK
jgi:hypothetical protein